VANRPPGRADRVLEREEFDARGWATAKPEIVLADEGYDWDGNVEDVEEMGTTAVIPPKRVAKRLYFGLTYQVHVKLAAISAVFRHEVLQRLTVLEQTNAL
jgi:hypothetical protein